MILISCSLCGIEFPDDETFQFRKLPHERFHKHCKKEKRNTTEGIVVWRRSGEVQ
jgi:hypothetical protein